MWDLTNEKNGDRVGAQEENGDGDRMRVRGFGQKKISRKAVEIDGTLIIEYRTRKQQSMLPP